MALSSAQKNVYICVCDVSWLNIIDLHNGREDKDSGTLFGRAIGTLPLPVVLHLLLAYFVEI
jgi:hypothetical protein